MAFAASTLIAGMGAAEAQSATTYSASHYCAKRRAGAAVPGALAPSPAPSRTGGIASQVNGAKQGVLVSSGSGGSLTISSVGSQTIVSSSVVATNSTVSSPINATQTS